MVRKLGRKRRFGGAGEDKANQSKFCAIQLFQTSNSATGREKDSPSSSTSLTTSVRRVTSQRKREAMENTTQLARMRRCENISICQQV